MTYVQIQSKCIADYQQWSQGKSSTFQTKILMQPNLGYGMVVLWQQQCNSMTIRIGKSCGGVSMWICWHT